MITKITHRPYALKPKLQELPECLITKFPNKTDYEYIVQEYHMIDTRTGELVAEMHAIPKIEKDPKGYYPIKTPYKSFKIEYLAAYERGKGYGTKFLKFAEKESQNCDCAGKVHLLASALLDRNSPPHVFYRKAGFTSQDTKTIKYLDRCIKNNELAYMSLFDNLEMYLPLREEHIPVPTQQNRFKHIKEVLKSFFNKK